MDINKKYSKLVKSLSGYESVAVAFSGGVDSTLLLHAAYDALGHDVLAITAHIHSIPDWELDDAVSFCKEFGIRHIVEQIDELSVEGFADNPKNRCYICKTALLKRMWDIARNENISTLVEGSNLDDKSDYRPGSLAVAEQSVKSPLIEIGFTKNEIREASKTLGLGTWDKQPCACLSSRISYGNRITNEKLRRIEKAERYILDQGFSLVRVRLTDESGLKTRIELLKEELPGFDIEIKKTITDKLLNMGFIEVSIDPDGYQNYKIAKSVTTG